MNPEDLIKDGTTRDTFKPHERRGNLEIIEYAGYIIRKSKTKFYKNGNPKCKKVHYWKAQCQCEDHTIIYAEEHLLKIGRIVSCGCMKKKRLNEYNAKVKSGEIERPIWRKYFGNDIKYRTKSRLGAIYEGMKRRCYNTNDKKYPRYGARGITICDEWLGEDGRKRFVDWAYDHGYSEDLDYVSIERIDINKGYNPDNCYICTDIHEQANNTCTNHLVKFGNNTYTVTQLCRRFGMPMDTKKQSDAIFARLSKGMHPLDAIFAPKFTNKVDRDKYFEENGSLADKEVISPLYYTDCDIDPSDPLLQYMSKDELKEKYNKGISTALNPHDEKEIIHPIFFTDNKS